jgi:hypothetical protein
MISLYEEMKRTSAEMPWFVAAVLLAVTVCIGVHAEIISSADGDRPRVAIGYVETSMAHLANVCERRVRSRVEIPAPGVTMMLGARGYWLEMTVPSAAIASKVDAVRSGLSLGSHSVRRRVECGNRV